MNRLHLSLATSRAATRKNTSIDTTLYELIKAVIDTIRPGEDAFIEATVQDLIKSGKLRWIRSGKHNAAARHAPTVPFLSLN